MRRLAIGVVLLLVVGCGGARSARDDAPPQRTDAARNPIKPGEDWSIGSGRAPTAEDLKDAGIDRGSVDKALECGVPPTLSPEQRKALPPGFDPDSGFGKPKSDFPMTTSVTPKKGDPGTSVTVTAVAPGQAGALMVLIVQFYDGEHHGMRAAKFADVAGRVVFKGPIPNDAPVGMARMAVSASTRTQQSSLRTFEFRVTGPGCR